MANEITLKSGFVRTKGTLVFLCRVFVATIGAISPHTPGKGGSAALLPSLNAGNQLLGEKLDEWHHGLTSLSLDKLRICLPYRWCTRKWAVRELFLVERKEQNEHVYGFSPVWVRTCFLRFSIWVALKGQWGQAKGFSPV
ncbi:hypothetical protein E2C01_026479 [Portunus trituberculatus]|uniref:Uncharacterized protein n=1 Tax=Portunus trituberculatus TaxID=210409 RepID=A0A5B7EI96_PORTR|nr:hypothetical protein [Portunus trituberculatus]